MTRAASLIARQLQVKHRRAGRAGPICPTHSLALLIRMASRFTLWSPLVLGVCLHGCAREHQPSRLPSVEGTRAIGRAPSVSNAGCLDEERQQRARETLRGLASYYHDSLSGNRTASGERYDPEVFSAAHRTLPFGTRLRLRRTDGSGQLVCVTVNDRGPFAGKKRVVDVSRRAAEHLEMVRAGIVPVLVEVL